MATPDVLVGANASSPPDSSPRAPAFWLPSLERALVSERTARLVVLILGALIFLPRLGSMGLWDPWETHYGEVAREMIVRDDYLYPHWESAYFFSKPPLAMWMMAAGMLLFGAESQPIGEALSAYAEWGVRLPFALFGMATIYAVYVIGKQLRDRATGVLAAVTLASSAQFIFIGKQSMVDMPLVGSITVGLALFIVAVFDPAVEAAKKQRASLGARLLAGAFLAVCSIGQMLLVFREMGSVREQLVVGVGIATSAAVVALIVLYANLRVCLLSGFYAFVGLAALAKGPAAIYVLGPLPILYVLASRDVHMLWRAWLPLGVLIFALVATPWFLALSLFGGRDDEGKTFVARFWIHDTFNRIGRGVHGDRPTIGYYLEQLAYGMFPWSAVAPFALGLAAKTRSDEVGVERRRVMTFVLVWALWGYVAFSLSKTGFHHYVFPAVPPLAVLVGYWLRWAAEAPGRRVGSFVALPAMAIVAVVFRDLIDDPQHLSSLFTYKYDRAYPRTVRAETILFLQVLGGLTLAYFLALWLGAIWPAFGRLLRLGSKPGSDRTPAAWGLTGLVGLAVVFGTWISHYHFNMLAQHWSQAHMFQTYFDEKVGDEPIYAYQLNWRGETYYSRNTVIQVKESGANERMRELVDRPGREFIVVEQSRFHTLKNVLSPDKRERLRILDKSSIKFYLCVVD